MGVVLAGIDEAGYGPLLGPLTVGMAVLRIGGWSPGEAAPDLWRLLSGAVSREARDKRGRIPVADSKRLKLPNDSASRHPLTHLERGVLAFLHQRGAEPATDAELFDVLGSGRPAQAWYAGEPLALPVAGPRDRVGLDANLLRGAMASAGVEVLALRCAVIDEGSFNQVVRQTGTKGEATLGAIGRHLRWLRDDLMVQEIDDPVRVVCDRLGGRTTYGDLLARELPGMEVRISQETPRVSRYELGERWAAHFQPEAESAHLAVALASMTAKLVRELSMARFNRYWAARMPELKPTAGYRADAARWLNDAASVVTQQERREMVRIA